MCLCMSEYLYLCLYTGYYHQIVCPLWTGVTLAVSGEAFVWDHSYEHEACCI